MIAKHCHSRSKPPFAVLGRKAIAPIIAFVLLMGLAVALGAFVTIWYTRASEKQTSELIGRLGTEEECSGVGFDVAFNYADCQAEVYNLGSFTIDKVKVDVYFADGSETHEIMEAEIIPKTGFPIPMELSRISRIHFLPIIAKGTALTQCLNDREFTPYEEVPNCPAFG